MRSRCHQAASWPAGRLSPVSAFSFLFPPPCGDCFSGHFATLLGRHLLHAALSAFPSPQLAQSDRGRILFRGCHGHILKRLSTVCQVLFCSIQRSRSRTSRNTRRSGRTTGNLPLAIICSTASFVRPK